MRVNYNVSAMIAQNALKTNDQKYSVSTGKLSSGKKINNAKDNPAGLAISRRMNAQIKGMQEANKNANNAINAIKTADGVMSEIQEMLQRMNELAVRAATDTLQSVDREYIKEEISQLKDEIIRIKDTTQFNGQNLLDGTFGPKMYTTTDEGAANYSTNPKIKMLSFEGIDAENIEVSGLKVGMKGDDYNYKISVTDDNGGAANFSYNGKTASYNSGAGSTIYADGEHESGYICIHMQDSNNINYIYRVNKEKIDWDVNGEADVELGKVDDREIMYMYSPKDATVTGMTAHITKENVRNNAYNDGAMELDSSMVDLSAISVTGDGKEIFPDGVRADVYGDIVKLYDGKGKSLTFQIDQPMTGSEKIAANIPSNGDFYAGDRYGMATQIGSNEGQYLNIVIPELSLNSMGIRFTDSSKPDWARDAIKEIKTAIGYVSGIRSNLGAYQNRLEHTVDSLNINEENMTSAYSTIMDTDMAEEMTEYSTLQVLTQAGISMLAQANQRPADLLQLLQ